MLAILGKKIGMSQFIKQDGHRIPVTILEAGPCIVTDLRSMEKNGYRSVQIGYGDIKEKHTSKPYRTQLQKKKLALKRTLKEIRLSPEEAYEVGQEIKADIFKAGDIVDVQGTSIGKGFAGGVKRWHWRGGAGSHGSMHHRRIGSAGASSFPSRTWPGHHMPGHLGDAKITVQNLEVVKVDAAQNMIVVKGSVPGGSDGILFIRKSLKKPEGIKVRVVAVKTDKKKDPLSKAAKAEKTKK